MEYRVVKSKRKTLSLTIDDDLVPLVKAPYIVNDRQIEDFVNSHTEWIKKATGRRAAQLEKYNLSEEEISVLKYRAKAVIPEKVSYYSSLMGLTPTRVSITAAKKRFGSCSGKNSLNFSCFLMLYPEEAIDYVVVHELAHIAFHNHSKEFYSLVEEYMPDYKEREKLLK